MAGHQNEHRSPLGSQNWYPKVPVQDRPLDANSVPSDSYLTPSFNLLGNWDQKSGSSKREGGWVRGKRAVKIPAEVRTTRNKETENLQSRHGNWLSNYSTDVPISDSESSGKGQLAFGPLVSKSSGASNSSKR